MLLNLFFIDLQKYSPSSFLRRQESLFPLARTSFVGAEIPAYAGITMEDMGFLCCFSACNPSHSFKTKEI